MTDSSPEIIDFPDTRVVAIRHVGPYQNVGSLWQSLYEWGRDAGEALDGALAIGISHDDPSMTPAAELRYDACLSIPASCDVDALDPMQDMQVTTLPGGKYAWRTHEGSYATLGDTYHAIATWVGETGRQFRSSPCMEIYRNDCSQVSEEDLRTDIYMPIL